MFACGYSGVRVAAFFENLAHSLAFVVIKSDSVYMVSVTIVDSPTPETTLPSV